jgi:nucleotide-binding universal stress UspA family protein
MPTTEQQLRVLVRHSAAEKDVALAGELLRHLDPVKRFAGVDVWSEARVRPGDDWRDEIRRAIDHADVALVLLSSDFLAADGIMDVEVPRLLERHRSGALRVIPVLLRSCLWKSTRG